MVGRLAGTIAAFLMTLIPATLIVHISMQGQGLTADSMAAISPMAALIGVSLAALSAVMTWRQTAPGATAGSAWTRATPASRAPISAEEKAALIRRTKFVFMVTLFATIAVLAVFFTPGRGPLAFMPQGVIVLPALMVAASVASGSYRRARDRLGAPFVGMGEQATAQMRAGLAQASNQSAGLLGWLLSALAGAARTVGKAFGWYRAGGTNAQDEPDWGLLGLLFGFGCLFFALGILRDAGPAFMFAALLFGTAAAMAYDRKVGKLLRLVAMPGLRHALLLLVSCFTMLMLLTTFDIALKPLSDSRAVPAQVAADLIGRILSAIAALLLAQPLLAASVRETPALGEERPLWPLFAALLGGGFCWFLLAGQWAALTWRLQYAWVDWVQVAMTASVLPSASLLIGAGASVWFQALLCADWSGPDWHRLFPTAIRCALGMTALALVVFLLIPFGVFGPARDPVEWYAEFSVITCAVWLFALSRIMALQPSSPLRAALFGVALTVLIGISFALCSASGDDYTWAPLFMLFTMPFTIGSWFVIAVFVPRWARAWL